MTQKKSFDVEGIEEAGNLVMKLVGSLLLDWMIANGPEIAPTLRKQHMADAERLYELLIMPKVGGALSLANPYPITIVTTKNSFCHISYAHCICSLFCPYERDEVGLVEIDVALQCLKELERVTGVPCNSDLVEKATSATSPERNLVRNDWIMDQHEKGKNPREIWERLKKQKKNWAPLPTPEGVRAVIYRRKKPKAQT